MTAVVSSAMMTIITAVTSILIRKSIAIAAILTDAVHNTASVPGTGFLVAGSAVTDAAVLADAVHITTVVAGTVAILIAGSIDRCCIGGCRGSGCRSRSICCRIVYCCILRCA